MPTATAEAPHKTEATVSPRTRKVEAEVLTATEAAALCGMPLHMLTDASTRGNLPKGLWRSGNDYLVAVDHADKLRAIASGIPAGIVYESAIRHDQRAAWERDQPVRDAVAQADARLKAEQKIEAARVHVIAEARRAQERTGITETVTDKRGRKVNASGARVV